MSNQETRLSLDVSGLKQEARIQAIIAEYTSLRDEIAKRSRDQLLCVTGSIVAVGGLLSTVATDPAKFAGLLVIAPWILAIFGILWCDHAHAIHLIGKYLREEIEQKRLRQLPGGSDPPEMIAWETYLENRRRETTGGRWKVPLGFINLLLPMLYFALPSVMLVIAYFFLRFRDVIALPPALESIFIGMGAFLLAALIFSWRQAYRLN